MTKYYSVLTEAGIPVDRAFFATLNEANQLKVTDTELTGMMKFITDKYNALDFEEIEKSTGDIERFKYTGMIEENVQMLGNIYESSPDPGAKKYMEVIDAVNAVIAHLRRQRTSYSTLYRNGNGLVQLLYTSLVASCLYATGTLVSNTIRFVTTEKDTDCQVLFDEIPGSIKHVHIKNVLSAEKSLPDINKLLIELSKPSNRNVMQESITLSGAAITAIAVGAIILLIPKIIVLIREIIYSIYYSRVKNAEMLQCQIDLIRTNIESLEQGRGNKKVIARQKKIADRLERWKNRIALKMDTTEVSVRTQMKKENESLSLSRNSPIADLDSTSGLLI